jgi:hypothetical protein
MDVNVRKSVLSVKGDESVARYQSSDELKRGFCRNCGSTLVWMPELVGYERIGASASLFDEPMPDKIQIALVPTREAVTPLASASPIMAYTVSTALVRAAR